MKRERPILFSSPMIRAILDGRKTQTRRIIAPPPEFTANAGMIWKGGSWGITTEGRPFLGEIVKKCPHGRIGDRLWVRETHAKFMVGEGMASHVPQCVAYRATCDADGGFDYVNGRDEVLRLKVTKWTPAIFMPRWASRITLEITGVRVQRLQEISSADACDEGALEVLDTGHPLRAECYEKHGMWTGNERQDVDGPYAGAVAAFATLWDSINGKPRPMLDDDGKPVLDDNDQPIVVASRSWSSNPWVWAITFRRST